MVVQSYVLSSVGSAELVEVERLSNKMLLIKHAIGLLPGFAESEIAHIHDVLDIGCGPGSWSLEMAQTYYRQMQITGVDSSLLMIAHANVQAKKHLLDNVRYLQVRNVARPCAFADGSFDLISMQCLSNVLHHDTWPTLLSACWRLLRPGGWLRCTDCEVGQSNAPAHEELWSLFIRAMRLQGRSFSPDERHLGFLYEMEPLLIEVGFETFSIDHWINYSSGTPLHEAWQKDFLLFAKSVEPMLVKMGVATQEQLAALHRQHQREMSLRGFRGVLPMRTVWGKK